MSVVADYVLVVCGCGESAWVLSVSVNCCLSLRGLRVGVVGEFFGGCVFTWVLSLIMLSLFEAAGIRMDVVGE